MAACATLACNHDRSLGFPCRKRCAPPALRISPRIGFCLPTRRAGPRSADGGGVKGGSCLSEASSADPRRNRAPQAAWSEAEGPRPSGRLFLCLLSFWRRKKKVSCCRATPGQQALPHLKARENKDVSRMQFGMTAGRGHKPSLMPSPPPAKSATSPSPTHSWARHQQTARRAGTCKPPCCHGTRR